MHDLRDPIAAGYYARKQIHCSDPLIAWSHRRWLGRALAIARRLAGARVLDCGYGDGTVLGQLQPSSTPPASIVGDVVRRSDGEVFHDHKGFNWRVVRAALSARFTLVSGATSPFNWTARTSGRRSGSWR